MAANGYQPVTTSSLPDVTYGFIGNIVLLSVSARQC